MTPNYEELCKALTATLAAQTPGGIPFKARSLHTFLSPYDINRYKDWTLEISTVSDPYAYDVHLLSPEFVAEQNEKHRNKHAIFQMLLDAKMEPDAASRLATKLVDLMEGKGI